MVLFSCRVDGEGSDFLVLVIKHIKYKYQITNVAYTPLRSMGKTLALQKMKVSYILN